MTEYCASIHDEGYKTMSDCEDVQILICNRPPSQIQVMDTENFMKNAPFQLSEEDKAVLCMPPEMFRPHTWDELKTIIGIITHENRCSTR